MLVTFKTEAYPNITMFGDVAVALIKLMGHSGTVPGALLPDDLPEALERLQAAVAARPDVRLDPATSAAGDDEDEEPPVTLAHRAMPLLALIKAARAERKQVMWES